MLVKVKVFPNSSQEEIIKKDEQSFEIKVKAPPRQGKANRSVVKKLASFLHIPPSKIRLKRGGKRRNKIFEILD